jgi:hypothetical protein
MLDDVIVTNWTITEGGNRKGANVIVRELPQLRRSICGEVVGWLDKDGQSCPRKKAEFAQIKRWSFSKDSRDIPTEVLIRLEEPPAYRSQPIMPWPEVKKGD